MTHGCVSGPGHGPRWESKCGADLRIEHGLDELIGASYGRVQAFYRRTNLLAAPYEGLMEVKMTQKPAKSGLSAWEKRTLTTQMSAVPTGVRDSFERAFQAWKDAWFDGGLAVSSAPQTRAIGKEFDDLVALGPQILPLVVAKLADPENFLALTLYDAIQPDRKLIVQFAADDERVLEGEQGRARRVLRAWFTNQ